MAMTEFRCYYKKSLFYDRSEIRIVLMDDAIRVCGFLSFQSVDTSIRLIPYDKLEGFHVTRMGEEYYVDIIEKPNKHMYCPGFDDEVKIVEEIKKYKCAYDEKIREIKEREDNERKLAEKESREYYANCFAFHIGNDSNPYYVLNKGSYTICAIYFNRNKDLNILSIDGNEKNEICAKIKYAKIHYFEKAGAIHYVSTIEGQYKNLGGQFTGAVFSKKAIAIGGLLFGTMGLAGGALLSAKPSSMKFPDTEINLSSDIQQVDDKNVILNYYSDIKKQYLDMELPAEIYNFLQTYIPDKKYEIVCELEKHSAVNRAMNQKASDLNPLKCDNSPKMSMGEFKESVDKLKYMFDVGMITEEVYEAKKMELMQQI